MISFAYISAVRWATVLVVPLVHSWSQRYLVLGSLLVLSLRRICWAFVR